jgi:hypothetical protein
VLGENELPPQVNDVSTKGEELFVSVDKSETVACFELLTVFPSLLSIIFPSYQQYFKPSLFHSLPNPPTPRMQVQGWWLTPTEALQKEKEGTTTPTMSRRHFTKCSPLIEHLMPYPQASSPSCRLSGTS